MASRIYAGSGFHGVKITFLFTTNADIKKVHQRFLKKRTPTDVITFVDEKTVDIIISVDQAQKQATPRNLSLFHELALLMCHGLLHAKGFDDLSEEDSLAMRKEEFEWMARILY